MKKRLLINLVASVLAFIVQIGISFLLTPFLVNKLGVDAYGFIGLANSFAGYAAILSVAINSMASRFVTLELEKNNIEAANKYYSSVFIANIFLSLLIAVITAFLIIYLQHIINIPIQLTFDVKLTFGLIFLNFIISLMGTVYTIASFSKNRIDISSFGNMISNLIKVFLLILFFILLEPKMYYIALVTVICSAFILLFNINVSKKIAKELVVKMSYFDIKKVKNLLSSGLWNTIGSLGRILLTGLDLLIANLFVNPFAMGVLAISKTVPTAIESLLATIGGVFSPNFVILYSQGKKDELIRETKFSIKLMSLIMMVPLAGFVIFGKDFYTLWLPGKSINEINEIQILSILAMAPYFLSASVFSLSYLDSATNKLKRPVIATMIFSIFTVITELILLWKTNLDLYAIAGVSSLFWCIKIVAFNIPNAARNLEIKLNTFFETFYKAMLCMIIVLIIMYLGHNFITINRWLDLGKYALIFGFIGYLISYFVLLSKSDKLKISNIINTKIFKKFNFTK